MNKKIYKSKSRNCFSESRAFRRLLSGGAASISPPVTRRTVTGAGVVKTGLDAREQVARGKSEGSVIEFAMHKPCFYAHDF